MAVRLVPVLLVAAALLLAGSGCGGDEASTPVLVGTAWQWEETSGGGEDATPDAPERYRVAFEEGGMLSIRADCNSVSGVFQEAAEGSLKITLGPSTLVACPEGSLSSRFLAELESVEAYGVEGDELTLELAGDGGSMRFAAA